MRKFHNRKMLTAATLLSCMMASQVMAAPQYSQEGKENTDTNGAITCFDKYLVLDDNADVPNYLSSYTIAVGPAVAGTATTPEVFAGVDAGNISIKQLAAFAPGQETFQSTQPGDTVTFTDDKKYAKQSVQVDFSNVTYTQPGIYRYIVTETPVLTSQQGITNDADTSRYMDVYVETEEDGTLGVVGYVFHKDQEGETLSDEPTFVTVQASEILRNGEYYVVDDNATVGKTGVIVSGSKKYRPATQDEIDTAITNQTANLFSAVKTLKDAGFTNTYTTYDLLLEKQVTGNQGNREEYFQFNVTVSGGVANSRYHVDLTNADRDNIVYTTNGVNNKTVSNIQQLTKATNAYDIFTNTGDDIAADHQSEYYFTTDAQGNANLTFYLKDDQNIEIWGLTENMSYSITEATKDGEGYDISYKQDVDKNTHDVSAQTKVARATVTTQMGKSDDTVVYDNYRNGVVPTGVIMTAAPFVTAAGLAGGLLALGKKRKKKEQQ